jgi:hypothetical protein
MKNKILILALTSLIAAPGFASIAGNEVISSKYLSESGYSLSTVDAVERSMAQTKGTHYVEPAGLGYLYEPLDWTGNDRADKAILWVKNFFMYIDPALDTNTFMNHSIKFSPSYDDL